MSEGEVWKDVVGYEGIYKVSNKGNVYSVERISSQGKKCGGRILKPVRNRNGYFKVDLSINGVRKGKYIHRLVTKAFIPNPENHPEVNHIDEDKANNNVENLEWCTSRYNTNHGTLIERISKKVRAINIKNGEVLTFSSTVEAERKGYNSGAVAAACRGVYNAGDGRTYRGHKWYYEDGE